MAENAANIRVIGFKTVMHITDAGERVARDWVTYAPAHSPLATQNEELVSRLMPKGEYRNDDDGLKSMAMRARWAVIGPAYEAWKEGRAVPQHGTPLATWPGVREHEVEALRMSAIRTVEEVAALTETQIAKIMLPNMRELREQAKRFLSSLDANKAAEQLRRRDEEVAALKDQVAELMAAMRKAPEPVESDEEDEAPRRRGRPPKSVQSVAEALGEQAA